MYFEDDKVARHYGDGFDAGYRLAIYELGLTKSAVARVVKHNARNIMWLELELSSIRKTIPIFYRESIKGTPGGAECFKTLNRYLERQRVVKAQLKKLRTAQCVYKAILRG